MRVRTTGRRIAVLVAAVALLAACGSSGSGDKGTATAANTDPVTVLYAGSLVNLMEHGIGPDFQKATGHEFKGEGKGSAALANEIKGKVARADVFVSANTDTNDTLRGAGNGDWLSWYATFGSSPLVLGYNPKSRFAADLKSKPWQQVVAEPGFRLGRTDPKLDPKGKLSTKALKQVGLDRLASGTTGVFPEEALVGRVQSGQLDAGFFYTSESTEQRIPTVGLKPVTLGATYTVTVLNRAQHAAAGAAFVQYLLGSKGVATMRAHGLTVLSPPTVTGTASAVPESLRSTLHSG